MPDLRSNQSNNNDIIISFLKSKAYSDLIKDIVENETKKLREDVAVLREEVVILRESNIQLLHMMEKKNLMFKSAEKQNNYMLDTNKYIKDKVAVGTQIQTIEKRSTNSGKKHINAKNSEENFKRQKLEKSIYISSDKRAAMEEKVGDREDKEDGVWHVQREERRRIRRRSVVFGTLKEGTIFKGVTKYSDFHVYNCDCDMTANDLKNYLTEEVKIPSILCEKMISKYPERYSSFKVSVPVTYIDSFKNPNIWPEYVCINRFNNRFLKRNVPPENENK